MKDETNASPFAAIRKTERLVPGVAKAPRLTPTSKSRIRSRLNTKIYHKRHYLSNSRINNIVKVKFVKNNKDSTRHIIKHIIYLEERSRAPEEPKRKFYDREGTVRNRDQVIKTMLDSRGPSAAMFKIILSPKQNELNHFQYTQEIMSRWEDLHGIITEWHAIEHKNTEHHHVHILMPGTDIDGRPFRLELDHINSLREIANEYQYELQLMRQEIERGIEQEFGYDRDELIKLLHRQEDAKTAKEIGIYNPELDKVVEDELARPTNFDPTYFSEEIQRWIWRDLKSHGPTLREVMKLIEGGGYQNNELYAGFVKEAQETQIFEAYFSALKHFHPAEYDDYIKNPDKDRTPAVNRLKQAFPEWHPQIIDKLKKEQPELMANYKPSPPKDREIFLALMQSDPGLIPERSKQIQEAHLDLLTLAYVERTDKALFKKIMSEPDAERQKEILSQARFRFPDLLAQGKEILSAREPDVYRWENNQQSNTGHFLAMLKNNPELFPQAVEYVKELETDRLLLENFYKEQPEVLAKVKENSDQKRQLINFIRNSHPDLVVDATNDLRKQMPELFKGDHQPLTRADMMKFVLEQDSTLFPKIMRAIKERYIDQAYFRKGTERMPDGLQSYVDDPELDRSPILKILKTQFKTWSTEISREISALMPELRRFEPKPKPKMDEAIRSLYQANVFKALKKTDPTPPSSRLEHLEQIKERLMDKEYFQKGREVLPDGLTAYWGNTDLDRTMIINGLRSAFPEWGKEIEISLRKTFKDLFRQLESERKNDSKRQQEIKRKAAQQRSVDYERQRQIQLRKKRTPRTFLDMARDAESDEQPILESEELVQDLEPSDSFDENKNSDKRNENLDKDSEASQPEDSDKEHEKNATKDREQEQNRSDNEQQEPLLSRHDQLRKEQLADEAAQVAKEFKTPDNWSGLTGPQQSENWAIPNLDELKAELRALIESTQRLHQEYKEMLDLPVDADPTLFKLEDALRDGTEEEKDHEQEMDSDR